MTKKAKSSNKEFTPGLFELPFMRITYGLFANRSSFDNMLKENDIPVYKFDTDDITYAATIRGSIDVGDGLSQRYAFIYAENMLNDDSANDAQKLSYLAHEAHHVVHYMFECMGEDKPSEEVFAYTLGKVCNNLFSEYFLWKEFQRG